MVNLKLGGSVPATILRMAEQFKQHGVPFLLKPILNGEHGGGDANEIEDAYKTMRQFIIRHLAADGRRKP